MRSGRFVPPFNGRGFSAIPPASGRICHAGPCELGATNRSGERRRPEESPKTISSWLMTLSRRRAWPIPLALMPRA